MNFLFRAIQYGLMHVWPLVVLMAAVKALPVEHLEFVAILVSVATLFRPLVGLSLGRVAIRYNAIAEGRWGTGAGHDLLRMVLELGLKVSLFSALAVGLVLAGIARIYDFSISLSVLGAAGAFIYLFGLNEFFDGLYRALGRFKQLASGIALSRLVGACLLIAGIIFNFSLFEFVSMLVITELVATAILLTRLWSQFSMRSGSSGITEISNIELLKYSVPVVINALSIYIYARAMVMIVGVYEDGARVGTFEFAVQIMNLPMAITIVLATVLSPIIARQEQLAARTGIRDFPALSMGASFAVWNNMMAAGFLVSVGPAFARWIFPELPELPLLILIFAPLIVFKAYAQFLMGEIAVALGEATMTARLTLAFGVVTIVVGTLLTAHFGIIGAAASILLVHTLGAAFSVVVFLKRTGVSIAFQSLPSIACALLAAAPAYSCAYFLQASPSLAALAGTGAFLVGLVAAIGLGMSSLGAWIGKPLRDGIELLAIARDATYVSERPLETGAEEISRSDNDR